MMFDKGFWSISLSLLGGLALAQAPVAKPPVVPGVPPAVPAAPAVPPVTAPSATSPSPSPLTPPAGQAPAPQWPDKVGGKDLKSWLQELKESSDGAVREAAVKAIPLFGPSARKEAFKPLLAAVKDSDSGVKINAIITIGNLGVEDDKEAKEIADSLAGAIYSSGAGGPVRLYAARSLASYGPKAASALPSLISIVSDPSWETRASVAAALGSLGRPADDKKGPSKAAMDSLKMRLKDEKSAPVRLEIVQALLAIGPPAYRAEIPNDYVIAIRPYLDAVLDRQKQEKDKNIQIWLLLLALSYDGQMVNDTNIRKFGTYLSDEEQVVRISAARAIALLGDRAKPVVPHLVDSLKNEDPITVLEVISCLESLEKTAMPAVTDLQTLSKTHKEEAVRYTATHALEVIQGKRPSVVSPTPVSNAPIKP